MVRRELIIVEAEEGGLWSECLCVSPPHLPASSRVEILTPDMKNQEVGLWKGLQS